MKIIHYLGEEYLISEWVKWVATDSDGTICGYSSEPYCLEVYGAWMEDDGLVKIGKTAPFVDWVNSLQEVA